MTTEELSALLKVAGAAGYSASDIEPTNPYKVKGSKGRALQIAAEALEPKFAAQWKRESMKQPETLESASVRAGILEMSQTAHNHMMETDAGYRTSYEETLARREAGWVSKMDEEAEKMRAARMRRQESATRRSLSPQLQVPNGDHIREFMDRIGGQQGLNRPARHLIK